MHRQCIQFLENKSKTVSGDLAIFLLTVTGSQMRRPPHSTKIWGLDIERRP